MKYVPRNFELFVNAEFVFRVYMGEGGTACLDTEAMKVLLFVGKPLFPSDHHFCYTVLGVRPVVLLLRAAFKDKTARMPFLHPKSPHELARN